MNFLLRHRYFRRECLYETWNPQSIGNNLPNKAWYFDFVNKITSFDTIWKLCELGDLRNLKKVKKSTYCKTITVAFNDTANKLQINRFYRGKYRSYRGDDMKIIDITLVISSFYGHLPIVQYLVGKGAGIHGGKYKALSVSAKHGHLHVVQYFMKQWANMNYDYNDILTLSAKKGHLPVVQYLVERGVDIHAKNDLALRLSAKKGHLSIVKYLVEHGADIHECYNDALRFSVEKCRLKVFCYLVLKGADVSMLNINNLKELNKKNLFEKN